MPMIFERRLIKMGEGGLVITVPKGWIRFYGLKAGDKLEVITDGEITIRPKRGVSKRMKG
jgi:AbrB family looped-hinge helix DNA binding protein